MKNLNTYLIILIILGLLYLIFTKCYISCNINNDVDKNNEDNVIGDEKINDVEILKDRSLLPHYSNAIYPFDISPNHPLIRRYGRPGYRIYNPGRWVQHYGKQYFVKW